MIPRKTFIRRRTRPRPVRQTSRAALIRENDRLTRLAVVKRGRARCIGCRGRAHDPHHYRGRALLAFRWDLRNVQPACRACHERFPADPTFERHAMIHALGERRFEELERDYVSAQTVKVTTEGIKARGEELRREVGEVTA
jgi:hypothetical protein